MADSSAWRPVNMTGLDPSPTPAPAPAPAPVAPPAESSSHQPSPVSNTYLKRALPDESDAENRRKTPKVSRACDLCKAKKVRCSGTLPCDICERKNLACVYNARYARGKPRTPPAAEEPSYEKLPPRMIEPIQRNRHESHGFSSTLPERSVSRFSTDHARADVDDKSTDSARPTFLRQVWKRLAERVVLDNPDFDATAQTQSVTAAGDRIFEGPRPDRSSLPAPDRPFHTELLEYYFEFCVVTYRIFHRPTVEQWLETALADYEQHRDSWLDSIGYAKSAILFTIFAIASLRKQKIASLAPREESKPSPRSDYYFNAAKWMTDMEVGHPTLESVQGRILQVLYLLQSLRMNQAWYLFGMIAQMVSALSLHKPYSVTRQAAFDIPSNYIRVECEKRTFWITYTIDRYLALVFGKPRHFHDSEIGQARPDCANDEDMTPEGNTGESSLDDSHIESLEAHAELAHFVGLINNHVYLAKRAATSDRVKSAREYTNALYGWQENLPPHLGTVRPSSLIPSFKRQSIALKLAFAHALVYANRPFLLSKPSYADHGTIDACVSDCLSGACQILELFEAMTKDTSLIHAFWWTSYVVFSALSVIYIYEIGQKTRPRLTQANRSRNLLELAESAQARLSAGSGASTPNQRYKIILEELRTEAMPQQQAVGVDGENRPASATDLFTGWSFNDWVELDASVFDSFAEVSRSV